MSANLPKDNWNREDCTIGMSPDGEVAIMTMPLKKYADNDADGQALLYGKFRELEAHVRQEFKALLLKKAQLGLVKPNGKVPPDLSIA